MQLFFLGIMLGVSLTLGAAQSDKLTAEQVSIYQLLQKVSPTEELDLGRNGSLPAAWQTGWCENAVVGEDLLPALIHYFNKKQVKGLCFAGATFASMPDFHKSRCTVLDCQSSNIGFYLNTYEYNQKTGKIAYPGLFPSTLEKLSLGYTDLQQLNLFILPSRLTELKISGNKRLNRECLYNPIVYLAERGQPQERDIICVRASSTGLTKQDIDLFFGYRSKSGSVIAQDRKIWGSKVAIREEKKEIDARYAAWLVASNALEQ